MLTCVFFFTKFSQQPQLCVVTLRQVVIVLVLLHREKKFPVTLHHLISHLPEGNICLCFGVNVIAVDLHTVAVVW